MQLYPVVATDAQLEIGTVVISAVLSLGESTYYRQTLPVSQNFVSSRCIVVLLGIFLSGYALLKVSRTISMRSNARE
jgi:hypothetical protein